MSARATKQVLAQALFEAIANNPHVPFTATLDNRIFRVIDRSESDGHIRMRLSRGNVYMFSISDNFDTHSLCPNRKRY